VFAAVALVLATVGLYSVVAHLVGQRTMEIGVRLALGAAPASVVRMVMRQGMAPVAFGLAIGACGAVWLGHLLQNQLFGTAPFDPLSFGVTAMSLILSALAACAIPARRAARIGPSTALRS
jgi:ABC-type antimicrobial peptide transport system permease subunit